MESFQAQNQYIKHLPYVEKVKQSALNDFEEIKRNVAKSILLNEIRPGLAYWTNRLQSFINEYGLCFDKEDHLRLIHIYLQIIFTDDVDLVLVDLCFGVLTELLK